MEALLIDILLPLSNKKIFKVFFILLDFIKKAEKITTNFANKLFNHFFIIISNV